MRPRRDENGAPRSPTLERVRRAEALTFDCYGTLIDWESGLLVALHEALELDRRKADDRLLEEYARQEARLEAGPYLSYREVLARSLDGVAGTVGARTTTAAREKFARSVVDWPAFADSPAALQRLAARYRLGIITNCDDDLFAASAERLGVGFEWVVTAQSAGRYKPHPRPFQLALQRIGLRPERVVHVAQSLYHDHVPALAIGLTTVWIDRRRERAGFGATPPADAEPDLAYPDLVSFVDHVA